MRKRKPRKPGKGYWQQYEWRRRKWYWRWRKSIRLILVGVFIGLLAGSVLYSGPSSHSLGQAELSELWDRYKPGASSSGDSGAPKGWEANYRRPPPDSSRAADTAKPAREVAPFSVQFSICNSPTRINCVVDGDTFWHWGVKIRIADIDTPEISKPRCADEADLGHQAKRRLQALLNAGPFQLASNGGPDTDGYGRKLRVVERDGQSLGMILVSEGLAHVWDGGKHPWC